MSSVVKLAPQAEYDRLRSDFALWSQRYDELPNPLLALEERFLAAMLPEVQGKSVLDIGCGTGRWLERLSRQLPRCLTGVDFSPEMLSRARQKLGQKAVVAAGDAASLPIANFAAEIVIASFVASYVPRLEMFAQELRRVTAPGGRIYISDIHPETAEACHWKRGFRSGSAQVEPANSYRSLAAILWSLRNAGFRITGLLEPVFGIPELEIFRGSGKLDSFQAAAGLPAIYILEIRPPQPNSAIRCNSGHQVNGPVLRGARVTLGAEAATVADIELRDGCVGTILARYRGTSDRAGAAPIHLNGYLLLPGLINAHDHLEFGLYPNLGRGPYSNSAEWARDIQEVDKTTIATHRSIPRDVRLWWGAIRNLLCGVTTVCHHNALHPELLDPDFPIHVVTRYGWSHSLVMDRQLAEKSRATAAGTPFVVHACEGVDAGSEQEVFQLDKLGVLNDRTVLVHGVALGTDGIRLLNQRGAALVWCPSSNRFLFGRTLGGDAVHSARCLLLGSDSPLTAAGDFLDEVRLAQQEASISAERLYRILFDAPGSAFRLTEGQGHIRPDASANLIAVRDRGMSPAETLARVRTVDIEMVIVGGRVQLASEEIYRRVPSELAMGLQPIEVDSVLRWIRAPLGRLFREAQRVLGPEIKIGRKRVKHVCSAWL